MTRTRTDRSAVERSDNEASATDLSPTWLFNTYAALKAAFDWNFGEKSHVRGFQEKSFPSAIYFQFSNRPSNSLYNYITFIEWIFPLFSMETKHLLVRERDREKKSCPHWDSERRRKYRGPITRLKSYYIATEPCMSPYWLLLVKGIFIAIIHEQPFCQNVHLVLAYNHILARVYIMGLCRTHTYSSIYVAYSIPALEFTQVCCPLKMRRYAI